MNYCQETIFLHDVDLKLCEVKERPDDLDMPNTLWCVTVCDAVLKCYLMQPPCHGVGPHACLMSAAPAAGTTA